MPASVKLWWNALLVASNIVMGAFVITAGTTRFVFPAVSMEGRAFWVLQASPLPIAQILRDKFSCWLVPIATISSVIFASGALAIDAAPRIVAINAAASWLICYGVVGMGVGLGAYFANFEWEHPSQLTASFGSLIYMLASTGLIIANMLPASLLIFLRTLRLIGYQFSTIQWYACVTLTAALLVYLNFAAARWALKLGENALLQRMQE